MIRCSRIGIVMIKSIRISRAAIRPLLLLTLMMTWLSSSGCATRIKVISADQAETFVKGGVPFTPAADGVFMDDARYQRYRRAVADAILKEQGK